MRIPRYWARAEVDGFTALGWSDQSDADALRVAQQRAARIAASVRDGRSPAGEYPYPDRPVREQVIDRDDAAGWAITRNGFGALVLNCANIMFIDMDRPAGPGLIGRLFGRKEPDYDAQIAQRVREVVDSMSGMGVRLYRTAAGFRAIVTTQTCDPTSDLSRDMLNAFGADQRYAALCGVQQCYRARLTPKPWRCGVARAPARYPFVGAGARALFERWLTEYDQATRGHGVCERLTTIGAQTIIDAARPVVELHDRHTLGGDGKGLA